jgi:hypothetical protein
MATTTTMDAAHDAIVAALRARFGDTVLAIGAYEPIDPYTGDLTETLETPALLLELGGFRVSEDDPHHLGRLACDCSWAIHCVLSLATPKLQQTLPQFAAAVVSLVLPPISMDDWTRGNLWGLDDAADPPRGVSASPNQFSPELNGRNAWAVRWDQTLYLDEELPE